MAITKETFRTLIREGQEEIREVELYHRPFEFEEYGRYVFVGIRLAGVKRRLHHSCHRICGEA